MAIDCIFYPVIICLFWIWWTHGNKQLIKVQNAKKKTPAWIIPRENEQSQRVVYKWEWGEVHHLVKHMFDISTSAQKHLNLLEVNSEVTNDLPKL